MNDIKSEGRLKRRLKRDKDDEEQEKKSAKKRKTRANDDVDDEDEDIDEDEQAEEKCTAKKRTKAAIKAQEENHKFQPVWKEYELLAQQQSLDYTVADNIIRLFEEGSTIPFIARYRRSCTDNQSAERLREIKSTYDEICQLKSKIGTVLKSLEKSGQLADTVKRSVVSACSLEELDYIYSPFKPNSKRTLANRAKDLGLEEPALLLLENRNVNLTDYVQNDNKELSSIELVRKGIVHIIAGIIATDTDLLKFLREMRARVNFAIKTKMLPQKETKATDKANKTKTDKDKKEEEKGKFENYKDFQMAVKYLKPHQILAINRGESKKILSVKVVVPDYVFTNFTNFCNKKWGSYANNNLKGEILKEAIEDSYNRLVQPLIVRELRAELKQKGERASCDVFMSNLKQLLMAPPLKGKPILGIDPGFANGCKLALISPMGKLLDHNVIYPHKTNNHHKDAALLKEMLQKHNCDVIALGSGTACRQTETFITTFIEKKFFKPLNVKYTLVSEDGASIYSCSAEAKKEFPDLDPNIISSVSLARRVQEPLSELVKIEPKHLGVGMYQHDLKSKSLEEVLNEVVSECVSFVGVDLNTTSQCLLKHVSGLTDKRATQIIEHRNKHGPFKNRRELMDVKGIGAKVFQQCAGFLRVKPLSAEASEEFYKNATATKLDCTYIHPESYDVALKLIDKFKLNVNDIGTSQFVCTVKSHAGNVAQLSRDTATNEETVRLIMDVFSRPLNHDLRSENANGPLFKDGIVHINDIGPGDVLTGRIENVTSFGCFTDIGVGSSGLIHTSKYNGIDLKIGNRVQVKVLQCDVQRRRIGLEALRKV